MLFIQWLMYKFIHRTLYKTKHRHAHPNYVANVFTVCLHHRRCFGWGYIGPWIEVGIHQTLFAAILSWKTLKGDWKEIEV